MKQKNNSGVINKEFFANKNALLATADGQKLVFADWSKLEIVDAKDKKSFYEALNTSLLKYQM